MKTKEQVIEFVATELKNGNSVVMATLSNGGSSLTLLQGDCAEFIEELNTYSFDGIVEGCPDMAESEYTEGVNQLNIKMIIEFGTITRVITEQK